jgi:chemotaxis-related protein WspD
VNSEDLPGPEHCGDETPAQSSGSIVPPADAGVPAKLESCWNSIGVYGQRTCEQLTAVVHCRNCAVYSQAAQRLLDSPLPAGYRQEWTSYFAGERRLTSPARVSTVLFRIANEWLALPTSVFQEIAESRAIHSLPHRRNSFLLGLANVRGELLLTISLLDFIRSHEGPARKLNCNRLLVAQSPEGRFLFPVDEVHGVYRFPQQHLHDPPSTLGTADARYTQGVFQWQNHSVGLLDPERLFPALNQSLS